MEKKSKLIKWYSSVSLIILLMNTFVPTTIALADVLSDNGAEAQSLMFTKKGSLDKVESLEASNDVYDFSIASKGVTEKTTLDLPATVELSDNMVLSEGITYDDQQRELTIDWINYTSTLSGYKVANISLKGDLKEDENLGLKLKDEEEELKLVAPEAETEETTTKGTTEESTGTTSESSTEEKVRVKRAAMAALPPATGKIPNYSISGNTGFYDIGLSYGGYGYIDAFKYNESTQTFEREGGSTFLTRNGKDDQTNFNAFGAYDQGFIASGYYTPEKQRYIQYIDFNGRISYARTENGGYITGPASMPSAGILTEKDSEGKPTGNYTYGYIDGGTTEIVFRKFKNNDNGQPVFENQAIRKKIVVPEYLRAKGFTNIGNVGDLSLDANGNVWGNATISGKQHLVIINGSTGVVRDIIPIVLPESPGYNPGHSGESGFLPDGRIITLDGNLGTGGRYEVYLTDPATGESRAAGVSVQGGTKDFASNYNPILDYDLMINKSVSSIYEENSEGKLEKKEISQGVNDKENIKIPNRSRYTYRLVSEVKGNLPSTDAYIKDKLPEHVKYVPNSMVLYSQEKGSNSQPGPIQDTDPRYNVPESEAEKMFDVTGKGMPIFTMVKGETVNNSKQNIVNTVSFVIVEFEVEVDSSEVEPWKNEDIIETVKNEALFYDNEHLEEFNNDAKKKSLDDIDVDVIPVVAPTKIKKVVDKDKATIGDTLEYTISAENESPDISWNHTLTDSLPDDVEYVKGSTKVNGVPTDDSEWTGNKLSLDLKLKPKEKYFVTYKVKLKDSATGKFIKNKVETDDPDIPVTPPAETEVPSIKLSKTVDQAHAIVGDKLTYTIEADNTTGGEVDWKGAIKDTLPEGIKYVADSTRINGEVAKDNDVWNDGHLSLTDVTVPAGKKLVISFQVEVLETALGKAIENVATTDDPNVPETPPTETKVVPEPGKLEGTKEADKKELAVGEEFTYTIKTTNVGSKSSVVNDVVMSDSIPAGLDIKSAKATLPNGKEVGAVINGQDVKADVGTLKGEETATLTITVVVTEAAKGQKLENVALIEGTTPDPEDPDKPGVPTDPEKPKEEVDVPEDPIVKLYKGVDKKSAKIGDTLTYTITVDNSDNSVNWKNTVKDNLPEELEYIEGTTLLDGVAQSDSVWMNQTLSIDVNVAAGKKATVAFSVKVLPLAKGKVVKNIATTDDPNVPPTDPKEPGDPEDPTNPPMTPIDPNTPETPGVPTKPGGPVTPNKPSKGHLPQTGEVVSSYLVYIGLVCLIGLGFYLVVKNKREE